MLGVGRRERLEREVGANAEQGRSEATQLAAEVSEQRRKAEDLGSKVRGGSQAHAVVLCVSVLSL